jgi:hypothetical protein
MAIGCISLGMILDSFLGKKAPGVSFNSKLLYHIRWMLDGLKAIGVYLKQLDIHFLLHMPLMRRAVLNGSRVIGIVTDFYWVLVIL